MVLDDRGIVLVAPALAFVQQISHSAHTDLHTTRQKHCSTIPINIPTNNTLTTPNVSLPAEAGAVSVPAEAGEGAIPLEQLGLAGIWTGLKYILLPSPLSE